LISDTTPLSVQQLGATTLYEQDKVDLKGHTIEELAEFANVSVDVIKAAIKMRQDQMSAKEETHLKPSPSKSTKATTTAVPKVTKVTSQHSFSKQHKVMNDFG
jgi:hypothetical protein